MSGTVKSADIEDIRKIFKNKGWLTDYTVKGSEPYSKGCKVFWKTPDGMRIETQAFDKNDDLFVALLCTDYHPRKVWPPRPGLFPDLHWVKDNRTSKRLEINKRLDQWKDLKMALEDFHIKTDMIQIKKLLTELLKKV